MAAPLPDQVALGRDAAVQVGQGLIIAQHLHIGHDAGEEVGDLADCRPKIAQGGAVEAVRPAPGARTER